MSTPSDLARRVVTEHEQTAARLAQLEQELTMTPTQHPNNDFTFSTTTDRNLASPPTSSSTSSPQPSQPHHYQSHQEDDDDDGTTATATVGDYRTHNSTPGAPSPLSACASPRYSIPTTASISRERDSASQSVIILRRQQARSEKLRQEMLVRKGQVDSELDRTLRSLQHANARQNTLTRENDALRSEVAAAKHETEQLRDAIVHSAGVAKESQAAGIRRWKDSEARLRTVQQEVSKLRATNQRLLHLQESREHQNELVLKLEEDKAKLETQLARTRRSLTSERNQSSEMSKLRYDLELLKAERKDLKRTSSFSSKSLSKCRDELDSCRDALSRAEARLNGKDRASTTRNLSRMDRMANALRSSKADMSSALARMSTLLSISTRPMLTSTTERALGSAVEAVGCQTLRADRCELWMMHDFGFDEDDTLRRLSTTSSPSMPTLGVGMTERDVRDLMRHVLVSREITQTGNIMLSPVYCGDSGRHDVIGVLWCVRRRSSVASTASSSSGSSSAPMRHLLGTPTKNMMGVITTGERKNSKRENKSLYDKTDILCIQQLALSTGVAYSLTKATTKNRESMERVRKVLVEVQQSAGNSKKEMMLELSRLQDEHASVSCIIDAIVIYFVFVFLWSYFCGLISV